MRTLLICLLLISVVGCAPQQNLAEEKKKQAEVNYKLGASHLEANNPTLALKKFLVAAENDPSNSSIQVGLAQAYQMKRAYAEAERHYQKALQLSNNDPRYLNNLVTLYLDMGEWDKAIEKFDQAAADLLFMSPHVALAGKAYAIFRKQDLPAALEQCEEVIAIAPGYAPSYFLKGEIHRSLNQSEEARKAYQRAVDLLPDYAQANYQLGILLLQEKETAEAIKHFKAVVEAAPDTEVGLQAADLLQGIKKDQD